MNKGILQLITSISNAESKAARKINCTDCITASTNTWILNSIPIPYKDLFGQIWNSSHNIDQILI